MTVIAGQRAQVKVPGVRTREVMLDTGASTDTPARDQGPGGSLPGLDAGHPLHSVGGHHSDDEDQGATVPSAGREWEPHWEPRRRTTSRLSGRARTADRDASEVTDWSERVLRLRGNLRISPWYRWRGAVPA